MNQTFRFLKKFLILLILFGVLDFLFGSLMQAAYFSNAENGPKTVFSILESNAEIYVFGSSRASHHYVPSIIEETTGMTCYNAGLDGKNIYYHLAVLKTILTRETPKIIILDLTAMDINKSSGFEDTDGLSVLNPFYPKFRNQIGDIILLQGRFERIKLLSRFYQYNSRLDDVLSASLGLGVNFGQTQGYDPLYSIWNKEIEVASENPEISIDERKVDYLKEFIKTAKDNGSAVITVISPVFRKKTSETIIQKIILEEFDVPIWSYEQDSLFLNSNHLFKDPTHLNHNGAQVFSKIIGNKLKQMPTL